MSENKILLISAGAIITLFGIILNIIANNNWAIYTVSSLTFFAGGLLLGRGV